MIPIFIAIAPVFLMIMLGYGLRRGGIPSVEFWNLNDKLVYWVLMPALFFAKISAADLSEGFGAFAIVLYLGFFGAIALGWVIARNMDPAQATSVMQGSARFNTFIGLALAEAILGTAGLQIAVLGAALLIPVVNITVVTLMTRRLGGDSQALVTGLVRNPLILSIGAGAIFNLFNLNHVPVLHDMAQILGNAALPIMLLCVGANLKLRGLSGSRWGIGLSSLVKLGVNPAIAILFSYVFGLDALTASIVVIIAALPTGVASYTLARQMGGDGPLMAAIITVQTFASFLTLPLTLAIVGWIWG